MREIKFRAWDKEFGRLVKWNDRAFIKMGDYRELSEITMNYFSDQRFIFMQYTGLHDKNGKEIYEGDILKARIRCGFDMAKGDYEHKFKNYVVEYWQSFTQIGYRLRNKSSNFMIKPSALHTMQVEVIGNIHDNPELMKESEDNEKL
ncbi:YopX family protein [Ruminiclostridium josui]|uniref:YopX family protein n=2 Tax=Ruminiclostridium josui TaxID=1499 RepID=UPI000463568E|nr:YopX family protein [Ruminiclostridium josui]